MRRPRTARKPALAALARVIATLFIAGFPAVTLTIAGTGCSPPAPRLFVLITVDTLRADYLGAYGSDRGLTPNLDALADESVVFTAAYSATSLTLPSISALLTGRYPEELGLINNESAVPDDVPSLAATLRQHGWRTAAVVSNFVLRASSGLAAGFDVYDDDFPQREAVRSWPERIAADTTDAFLGTLDACTDGRTTPCFVWVHYQDPHGPYTPPAGERDLRLAHERGLEDGVRRLPLQETGDSGRGAIPRYQYLNGQREIAFYRAGYAAEVAYMDREVGRLLDGLRERGFDRNAVVVFSADHGEALGEGDYWFSHGEHLLDAFVRVPLMVRAPALRPAQRDDLVAAVDLYPTMLSLLGVTPETPLRGRDLLAPDAHAENSVPYMTTLGAGAVRRFAVVDGDYKFIVSLDGTVGHGQLFRRGKETVNLVAPAPQIASSLRKRLTSLRKGLELRGETAQHLSPEDLDALRALGYVDTPEPETPNPAHPNDREPPRSD
jgi:arylsulfatase